MTTGHRDDLAGVEESRGADQPVFDCTPQTPVPAADIAHRRKAAIEGKTQHADRMRGSVRIAGEIDFLHVDVRCIGMDVGVDEPGHQGSRADLDDSGLGALDRLARNLADSSALHENVLALRAVLAYTVKNAGV